MEVHLPDRRTIIMQTADEDAILREHRSFTRFRDSWSSFFNKIVPKDRGRRSRDACILIETGRRDFRMLNYLRVRE